MRGNWRFCFEVVLDLEGANDGKLGWTNHPNDSGGPTLAGITYNNYAIWRGHPICEDRRWNPDVITEMRCLRLPEIEQYYRQFKWDPIRGDDLRWPFDLLTFEGGTLHGPKQAVKFLQRALGLEDDGAVGPLTLAVCNAVANPLDVAEDIIGQREEFCANLAERRPKDRVFLQGWLNRLARMRLLVRGERPPLRGGNAFGRAALSDAEFLDRLMA